ncbi:phosphate transport system permease protein [Pseudorhodoplanes sinuspersici]|uniref:Phosphate transport system permease protein PstA n=1 Tax=Pseudorhodoplanes sinuspersici TaxID=1235591 RepID=A0A1W6ZMM9_9HYPH|nr:phosphate ABC transporter permease PstA [Pseudorhodoplanes sinuspersici]ARP98658.1 phosphate ABC transporter, permease protein PstA [Pseudorhodoplanes sinuspersici]RKE69750.1 phosphate transport system permease protein [Pseudorhodoplanes sinuspersici]
MTDTTLSGVRTIDLGTDAARARVKARYRAEARFRFYGLAAIGLTAIFLVVVLTDIIVKGLPAFTQNSLQLNVNIDPAEIDPKGSRNPDDIRAGDFQALVRNALRAEFPDAKDRTARRQLDSILSSGASDYLRERVVADPSLIGQTVTVPVLMSSDGDLYFKGIGTKVVKAAGLGTATPSGTSGEIEIKSTSNDFANALALVKQALTTQARNEAREAERLQGFATSAETRAKGLEADIAAAKSANNASRVAALESQLAAATEEATSLSGRAKELREDVAALEQRYKNPTAPEPITDRMPSLLIAINGGVVKVTDVSGDGVKGDTLISLSSADPAAPGAWQIVNYQTPEGSRRLNDRVVTWLDVLKERGLVQSQFNWRFFSSGDSREPELAGIRGALVGSALTLLVTLVLCLPLGVAGAIYLEEFAPKNWLTEIIEVNINNLAAVPSIVFGLLGLAVFLNFFGLPRSAPLVGGLVLALLVLPTIIIASRAALKAVPPSIKEAALGIGASKQQAIFHHVLPLAMPGIMTGTIIGMAHALGETAPLLMIGMVAFIVEPATSIFQSATVMPVQIYLWSDLPEIGFQARTAAAIMVLLAFLFVMNGTAIILRKRFERRW